MDVALIAVILVMAAVILVLGLKRRSAPNVDIGRLDERLESLNQRLGAEELAGAIVYLSSPLSAYLTGQVLHVDGGVGAHL
ncbi:MAG: SDR family oxidoreductase [Dehalococcoidia bacterium]|nr:SDR family oxidoreductase [Dehalococcoidia bacterium]